MRKPLRAVVLVVLCAGVVVLTWGACHAAPRLQVDRTVYDAGTVPEGREVTHAFLFRNVGNQDLVIKPKAC